MGSPLLDKEQPADQHQHRQAAYAAEATGLLLMAVIFLIITVIRYGQMISWSAR